MKTHWLTPRQAAAIYTCLRECPPFNRWKLPPAEEVKFVVNHRPDVYGEHTDFLDGKHRIVLSKRNISHFNTVAGWMAHEMIHLHQATSKLWTSGSEHNTDFKRKAERIARLYGWDPHTLRG